MKRSAPGGILALAIAGCGDEPGIFVIDPSDFEPGTYRLNVLHIGLAPWTINPTDAEVRSNQAPLLARVSGRFEIREEVR